MIKVILFDCDGLIIRHEKYFTIRLAEKNGIKLDDEKPEVKKFFSGVFLECEVGKADLKQELKNNFEIWDWQGTVESLMEYWFSGEAHIEVDLKEYILSLRGKGIKCFLSTNNEKYRSDYLWNVAGLKNIFDGWFPSSNVGHFKDETIFWEKVYGNFLSLEKKEILVWDDDLSNIESATKFGFNSEHYENFEGFKKIMEEKYKILNESH